MSNLTQRLLLFFIGIPTILAIIIFLPQYHHAAIVIFLLVFAGGSSVELAGLFRDKGIQIRPWLCGILGISIPLLFYVSTFQPLGYMSITGLLLTSITLVTMSVFVSFAFIQKDGISSALPSAAAYGFTIIYPGIFSGFIVLIAAEPRFATEAILSFACMVMSNDSLAWLVGMTLGRRRGIVAVSPNKSLAGFVGGFSGSILGTFLAMFLFPASFPAPLWAIVLMAMTVGTATITGDLFESALKRSAGIKDSGSAVPGRGGFLDSFDSIMFAAPVFYAFSAVLGLFR